MWHDAVLRSEGSLWRDTAGSATATTTTETRIIAASLATPTIGVPRPRADDPHDRPEPVVHRGETDGSVASQAKRVASIRESRREDREQWPVEVLRSAIEHRWRP